MFILTAKIPAFFLNFNNTVKWPDCKIVYGGENSTSYCVQDSCHIQFSLLLKNKCMIICIHNYGSYFLKQKVTLRGSCFNIHKTKSYMEAWNLKNVQ